jgi:superfamily II DNA/RNA helicase
MSFNKILSHRAVLAFLAEQKLKEPTKIQSLVIPDFINGKSVNVIAKTGSGKTYCFALPISELLKVHEEDTPVKTGDPKAVLGKPRAVILAPTRELALQLQKVFKSISHHVKLRVRMLAGGEAAKTNHLLARDNIDILIATPGRLSSALKRKELTLKDTKYLIMDEADQLLEMGFRRDLETIYKSADSTLVHVGLFSATHSESLDEFCSTIFKDIDFASYNSEDKNKLTQSVRTFNIYLKDPEKLSMTEAFVKNQAKGSGIIFVNKHETVDYLYHELPGKFPKLKFHALHGEMEAKTRKKNYDQFLKEGGILISTDITARGMDIDQLVWVMNYDLPFEAVYYIHRCGRVGRQQTEGFAYNLVTPKDVNIIVRINEAIQNQSAIKLSSFDEKKFDGVKAKAKVIESKLDKKKKQLDDLKKKVFAKKKPSDKKHVKLIKSSSTPRYKREEVAGTRKKTGKATAATGGARSFDRNAERNSAKGPAPRSAAKSTGKPTSRPTSRPGAKKTGRTPVTSRQKSNKR